MVYGFGRGSRNSGITGNRGGAGLGFRGSSLPWPYVGRGRGGLPRCSYYIGGQTIVPSVPLRMNKDQEISFLRSQADDIKKKLGQVESRLHDLEKSSLS